MASHVPAILSANQPWLRSSHPALSFCKPLPLVPFFPSFFMPLSSFRSLYISLACLSKPQRLPSSFSPLFIFLQGKSHQINDHLRAPAAAMAATNLTSLDQFSFAPVEGVELVDPDKDAVYSARFGGEEGYLVCLRTDGV